MTNFKHLFIPKYGYKVTYIISLFLVILPSLNSMGEKYKIIKEWTKMKSSSSIRISINNIRIIIYIIYQDFTKVFLYR